MSEDVDTPWKTEVSDVSELQPADFEPPNCTIHIANPPLNLVHLVDELARIHGLNRSSVIDRGVRCLIAGYCDTSTLNLRERYGVRTLIPPEGWVGDHQGEWPEVEVEHPSNTGRTTPRTLRSSVPSTVYSMMFDLIDEYDFFQKHEDVAVRGVYHLASSLSSSVRQRYYSEPHEAAERELNFRRGEYHEGEEKKLIPLNQLLQNETRRNIIELFLLEVDEDEWLQAGDVAEHLDVKADTLSEHLPIVSNYGILNQRGTNPKQYSLARDGIVVSMLYDLNDQLFHEYFEARTPEN